MSKRQKARKHRTVNRAPRPAAEAPLPQHLEVEPGPGANHLLLLERLSLKFPPPRPAARPAAAGAGAAARSESGAAAPVDPIRNMLAFWEADGPVFYNSATNGGLGHHAARTWRQLRVYGAEGATVGDLCASVGYQARTILKHLSGLARYGLAVQEGERWHSTGKSQEAAADEHNLRRRTPHSFAR